MARERKTSIVLAALAVTATPTIADNAAWCGKEWDDNSGKFVNAEVPDFAGLLAFWKGHEQKCAGTVLYEARLAYVLFSMGKTAQAREVIAPFVGKKSPYSDLVDLVGLSAEFAEQSTSAKPSESELRSLEKKFEKFVGKYPSSAEGFAMLGGLRTILGEHKTAVAALETAARTAGPAQSKSGIYRNLAVSQAALGEYDSAFSNADLALKGNKSLTGDPDFMIAVIRAQSGLGMFAEAQNTARLIAKKQPSIVDDADFDAALDFLFERMNAGKK